MPSNPVKFQLFYTEHSLSMLEDHAKANNFSNLSKFVMFRLSREAQKLHICQDCEPGERKRIYLRINNDELIMKLDYFSKLHGIPVAVLIKQLTTDPIIVGKL